MSQYQRILCFVDPEKPSGPALSRAAAIAHRARAALHLSLIDFSAPVDRLQLVEPERAEKIMALFVEARRRELSQAADRFRGDAIQLTTQVTWATDRLQEMLTQITEYGPDLVVKAGHREPRLQRLLVPPRDWLLLRDSPAPVMLVGPLQHGRPRRILVAIDIDEDRRDLCQAVLRAGLTLAVQCDAELDLAYALEPLPPLALGQPDTDYLDLLEPGQRARFDEIATRSGVPAERRHFLIGHAATSISALAAERQVDVLVIGASRLGRAERILLGSTAEQLLQNSHCDVLAVPLA